jgi:PAS domain S-box-containing protein
MRDNISLIQRNLAESEEQFRRAVVEAPIPIIMHAEDGEVLLISKKWAELSGYSHTEIPTIADWTEKAYGTDHKYRDQQNERITALYKMPTSAEHEAMITTASGKKRLWEVRDAPLGRLADGRRFVISMVNDVTEQRQAEKRLREAQKMEAIGELTGGIAHDFNNLLMVSNGYTHNAFNDADHAEKVRRSLDEVLKANERAAQLTKQLLAFSRRQVMEKRVFRIRQALAEIEQLLQHSTGERYAIDFNDNGGKVCVETDRSEFGQAIINLVINARDAMPTGGTIEIATNVVELDEDFTSLRQDMAPGRHVEVSVRDRGTGIDEETMQHIFEPFFTTKDQGKGTGLGLAMIYGFAQHSSGCVDVESSVGEGTCFRLYLPASDRDPEVLVAEVEGDCRGRGETVLLVEDDIALLELVRGMLEALGYNVLAANDGSEALEIEMEHEGDIALMLSDVVMPVIGVFELVSMLRESHPDLKVVFMSGYPNRAAATDQQIPDDCEFLQKPVEPDRLAKVVRNRIDAVDRQVSLH